MEVVLKGFEGAMMLGEKKSIDQKFRFCRKRSKNWEILGEFGCAIFGAFLANCDRAT